MDGSSGTALLLWDNRYRTDKDINSGVKLSKIIVLKTDLINRVVTEIGKLINTVVIEIDKTTKITVVEIIKIIRLEIKNTIRKIPAITQKQPLTCKHAVAVYYAISHAYFIAYAQITR